MKRLVAREFTVEESDHDPARMLPVGDKYVYFEDPETGKFYRPVEGFEVLGDVLDDRFVEVEP